MTRARSSSAGQAAPVPTPSGDEGPRFTLPELEALYLLARESYAPSARYEAQKSAVRKLRTLLGFENAMNRDLRTVTGWIKARWGDGLGVPDAVHEAAIRLAGPRRTVKAAKKERKAAENVAVRYGWEIAQENRASCVARAGVKCERFISGIHRCDAMHTERDHFWGRARDESADGSWMLCRHCHSAKTHNRPSRAHWIQLFKEHCLRHGYAEQVEKCDRALALEQGQHPAVAR